MERSAGLGKAENQAAWAIFVIRVILDNFTSLDRLSDFTQAYAAQDGLIGGVQPRTAKRPWANLARILSMAAVMVHYHAGFRTAEPLSAGVRQPISLTHATVFRFSISLKCVACSQCRSC